MPVIPLLFARPSQNGPLRVSNPIRCNRRILSQPYPDIATDSVRRSEDIFRLAVHGPSQRAGLLGPPEPSL